MSNRVEEQITLATELVDEWWSDGHEMTLLDFLDYLAICGFKLKRCVPSDFDAEGVSVSSRAYFTAILAFLKPTA